jgi:hypothetical protein
MFPLIQPRAFLTGAQRGGPTIAGPVPNRRCCTSVLVPGGGRASNGNAGLRPGSKCNIAGTRSSNRNVAGSSSAPGE